MTLASRLKKIETSLTPKQAALLWLKEAQQFPAFLDYLKEIAGEPITAVPRVKIPNKAAEAVWDSLKYKFLPAESIAKAESEARRQADFLVVLVLTINDQVLTALDLCGLWLELLWEQRWRMARQFRQDRLFESTPGGRRPHLTSPTP